MSKKHLQNLHVLFPCLHDDTKQAYDALVSSFELFTQSLRVKAILITSTQPREGKSTVATNLSAALSLTGKNILLLDGDTRKPKIHELLKLPNTVGFTDILHGTMGVRDVIQHFSTSITTKNPMESLNLSVITSGPSTSSFSDPKAAARLTEAFEYLKNIYDVVVVDAPPVLAVNDALVFARLTDFVLFVIGAGLVKEADAKRAKSRLEQAGAKNLSLVMNFFDSTVHGPSPHPFSAYYR